jgi:hypothetical protein
LLLARRDHRDRLAQPLALVHQLTPRSWKQMFAATPLRSDLHDLAGLRMPPGG